MSRCNIFQKPIVLPYVTSIDKWVIKGIESCNSFVKLEEFRTMPDNHDISNYDQKGLCGADSLGFYRLAFANSNILLKKKALLADILMHSDDIIYLIKNPQLLLQFCYHADLIDYAREHVAKLLRENSEKTRALLTDILWDAVQDGYTLQARHFFMKLKSKPFTWSTYLYSWLQVYTEDLIEHPLIQVLDECDPTFLDLDLLIERLLNDSDYSTLDCLRKNYQLTLLQQQKTDFIFAAIHSDTKNMKKLFRDANNDVSIVVPGLQKILLNKRMGASLNCLYQDIGITPNVNSVIDFPEDIVDIICQARNLYSYNMFYIIEDLLNNKNFTQTSKALKLPIISKIISNGDFIADLSNLFDKSSDIYKQVQKIYINLQPSDSKGWTLGMLEIPFKRTHATFAADILVNAIEDFELFQRIYQTMPESQLLHIFNAYVSTQQDDHIRLHKVISDCNNLEIIKLTRNALRKVLMLDPALNYFDKKKNKYLPKKPRRLVSGTTSNRLSVWVQTKRDSHVMQNFSRWAKLNLKKRTIVKPEEKLKALLYDSLLRLPFYLNHAVYNPNNFSGILKDGSLYAAKKFSNDFIPQGISLYHSEDNQHGWHIYFSLTTHDDPWAPGALDDMSKPFFKFNLKTLLAVYPEKIKYMYIHRYDNSDRKCMLSNRIKIEVIQTDVNQYFYQAFDLDGNPLNERYSLDASLEYSIGENFQAMIAANYLAHLEKLPIELQNEVLAQLDEMHPLQRDDYIKSLITGYCDFEATLPNNLQLKIEYVDIVFDGKQRIDISKIRVAIEENDVGAVKKFFGDHPQAKDMPFVVNGAMRLAYNSKHKEVLRALFALPSKKALASFYLINDDLLHIERLVQIIYENHEHTYVDFDHDTKELTVTTKSSRFSNEVGTHHAQLPPLLVALGNRHYANCNTFETACSNVFTVRIDGKTNQPNSPLGHAKFENLLQVRDALLTHELNTLLTSAENYQYYLTTGNARPITGNGATNCLVSTRQDRLPYTIQAEVYGLKQYIKVTVEKHQIQHVMNLLNQTLPELNGYISNKGKYIIIERSMSHFLHLLRSKRIDYNGLIVLDENGNLLLADRNGLSSPGGHHSDPYHHNIADGLKSEYQLECIDPSTIQETMPIIGKQKQTGIFLVPYKTCRPTKEAIAHAKQHQLSSAYKADPEEFSENSEVILSLCDLRGKKCRNVMPLELIANTQLQACVDLPCFADLNITINTDCEYNVINSVTYKIPCDKFGLLVIQGTAKQIEELHSYLSDKLSESNAVIIINSNELVIDKINPLDLVKHCQQELSLRYQN